MAMVIIGILMIVGAIALFVGFMSDGILFLLLPACLFGVGGLVLLAIGLSRTFEANPYEEPDKGAETDENNTIASEMQTVDLIREYKKLADEGIITETEFKEKKKQLLS